MASGADQGECPHGLTRTTCSLCLGVPHHTRRTAGRVSPSSPFGVWWINQGRSYKFERAGGFVYAGRYAADGRELDHHTTVSFLAPGDVTLHAATGLLRAIGTVREAPK